MRVAKRRSRRPRRLPSWPGLGAVLLCAALLASLPAQAAADGDPASDALIEQNVFYPYSSPVPQADQNRLNAEVAAAHRAGIDLKVAVIARKQDLGSITALYGDPHRYAAFLDDELSYGRKVPLLVVMPDGFGVEGLSARAARAIAGSPPPHGAGGADLAVAARTAIARALRGTRHASSATAGSAGGFRAVLLLSLILAAVLVGGALVVLRVFFPPSRAGQEGPGGNA